MECIRESEDEIEEKSKCTDCNGKGFIINSDKPGDDSMCDKCHGSGEVK